MMNIYGLVRTVFLAFLVVLGLDGAAFAFHDGGVAVCDGCHSMHNSAAGIQMVISASTASSLPGDEARNQAKTQYLLIGSDQSSTCLHCHANSSLLAYTVMTFPVPAAGLAPVNYTPGGDFAWLLKNYDPILDTGTTHGHNIVAADFNLTGDTILTQAPGGTYPATYTGADGTAMGMACSSCHDPHGRYRQDLNGAVSGGDSGITATHPISGSGSYPIGSTYPAATSTTDVGVYRLLGGVGYIPKSMTDSSSQNSQFAFTIPSPVAVAPEVYNQIESTNEVRVAYGTGMSEWCGNCHTFLVNNVGTLTTHRHPAGATALMTDVFANYNAYVASGNMDGVNVYTSLVPFEEGATQNSRAILSPNASSTEALGSTNTPFGAAVASCNVMCLSCHRAHASAFPQAGRWDFDDELLVNNGVYNLAVAGSTTLMTEVEYTAAMYGRTEASFATFQRSLCNKCHAQD
jgi:hypothetical protein